MATPRTDTTEDEAVIDFADFREMRMREGGIKVRMDDGKVYTIPPADLWPDMPRGIDDAEAAKLVMGKDAAAFVKAGGGMRVIGSLMANRNHLPEGESEASSDS